MSAPLALRSSPPSGCRASSGGRAGFTRYDFAVRTGSEIRVFEVEPPLFVFVTAYSEHALKAFEAHALDYLLKPARSLRDEALRER